jgi:hypothetical protein
MYFDQPFNNDKYIANTFLKLKEKYNILNAVETGTFEGGTTAFLSENFNTVYSIESNYDFINKAAAYLKNKNLNPTLIHGKSENILPAILNKLTGNTIFYLDAHWYEHCPLLNELNLIKEYNLKPIIAIHDFYVPGASTLGYDTWNNQILNIDWIKDSLNKIYDNNYSYFYNNDLYSEGAKRGIIYITPNN